ncbi:MAG: 50S ribosomal protein L10 [Clostridiales bacterium]|nr:50S ribosomal protein L10 [Clostridiales bacterium]
MSENLERKKLVVSEVQEKLGKAKSVVFVDYIGLTVAEVTELRNQFRAVNVEFKVYKNAIIGRAADNLEIDGINGKIAGPTAVALSYDDPTAGPKVMTSFIKKVKKTEIKMGVLGKEIMSTSQIESLAKIPNKEALVSVLLSVMNGPVRGFATVLNAVPRSLAIAVNAIKEQKQSA